MKIALCLSGQPRGLPQTSEFVRNNLIVPNNITDIFVHTWYDKNCDGKPFDSAQPNLTNNIGKWLPNTDQFLTETLPIKDKSMILCESPRSFEEFSHLENRESAIQTRLASMFYSAWACNKLKSNFELEHGFRYDVVIKTRIDIFYHKPVILKDIVDENLNTNVYVPEMYQHMRVNDSYPAKSGGTYSSLSDTFAIGSSDNMDRFCSVYENFSTIHGEIFPYVYGEAYLGYVVRGVYDIPISMKDIRYNLHRG